MAYFDLEAYLKGLYTDEDFKQIISSFKSQKDVCIFINILKCKNEELENTLKEADISFTRLDEYCYKLAFKDKEKLSRLELFFEAGFYIQNHSSYLCALNLNVKSGENVLDMCAAPGGKSINLANFMQNKGYLACVEANKERFFTLKKLLHLYGLNIHKCFHKDAKTIGRLCPLKFDKILLDAPCSTFAKMGFNLQKSQKELKNIAHLQKRLLHSALKALKIGGELVYSTCTFLKEENEEVLENALRSEFDLKFLPLELKNAKAIEAFSQDENIRSYARRILPDDLHDGFFIARLQKLG